MTIGTNRSSTGNPKFDSIATLKTVELQPGATVETEAYTAGWAAAGNLPQGGATYNIISLADYTTITGLGAADGLRDHGLDNDNVALLTTLGPLTFADTDATPSVAMGNNFNTFTNTLTITDFDDAKVGQEITVVSKAAITFDTTGTSLTGSSVDIVTAAGDITKWYTSDGITWILTAFVDVSVDNSAGA